MPKPERIPEVWFCPFMSKGTEKIECVFENCMIFNQERYCCALDRIADALENMVELKKAEY
jgi:hypothetical protein